MKILEMNDARRLEALQSCRILGSAPEESFDRITRLIAQICETPVAFINFPDEKNCWFKSQLGLDGRTIPVEHSFCAQALKQGRLFVVHDAAADERFAKLAIVKGEPGVRFYAGMPLIDEEGHPLGTFGVMDYKRRKLTNREMEAMGCLAQNILALLESRRDPGAAKGAVKREEHAFGSVSDAAKAGAWEWNLSNGKIWRSLKYDQCFGYATLQTQWNREIMLGHVVDEDQDAVKQSLETASTTGDFKVDCRVRWSDHSIHWIEMKGYFFKPDYLIGTVSSIDDRKRNENSLVNQAKQFLLGQPKRPADKETASAQEITDPAPQSVQAAGSESATVQPMHPANAYYSDPAPPAQIAARSSASSDAGALGTESEAFFANVFRELRTPLSLLLSPLDALLTGEQGELSESQKRSVQHVRDNSVELRDMVNGLIEYSEFEAGKVGVKRQPVEIVSLVSGMMEYFLPTMKQKNLEFSFQTSPLKANVSMDPHLLERIMIALLTHAVKYAVSSSEIFVGLKAKGGQLQATVSYPGAAPEASSRDMFFDKTKLFNISPEGKLECVGLELMLAKQIAGVLGGSLSVSGKDRENTFAFMCSAPASLE